MTLKTWAGAVLLAWISASSMHGQSGLSTGEIRGRVIDSSQAPIIGSSIDIVNPRNGWSQSTKSNGTGNYQVPSLEPGTYEVKVAAAGFRTQHWTGVSVTVGRFSNLDFKLEPGSPDPIRIDVTATMLLTEPQRSAQSSTILDSTLRTLPMDRHDYLSIAKLVGGVADSDAMADVNDYRVVQAAQSGISFHGNNGRGNSIVVDGGEANDSGGGVRPTLSQDAVEEFQVNLSNFSAELGGASGGLISIISKKGVNQLHGSGYGFFRFNALDAADPFARVFVNGTLERVKPPSNRQQYGATLGGAIRPDRTFYFAAFEGLNRDESNSVAVLTDNSIFNPTPAQEAILAGLSDPAQAAALRQALTASPATQELFAVNSGVFPYSGSDYKFSMRLDHELTSRDQLMFRFNFADLDDSNPNARALIGASRSIDTSRLDDTGSLSWTRYVSSSTVNRLQYQFNYGNFRVSTLEKFGPSIDVNGFGYFNRDVLLPSNILWRRHNVTDSLTMVRGKHQLKFGESC